MDSPTRAALPADATSASLARRLVRDACAGVADDLDSLLLCTSELVTNAVLHGAPPLELEVLVTPTAIRVQVRDGSAHVARRRDPIAADTFSGRGLAIVEGLTTRWGCDPDASGKVTWFEVDRA